MVTEIICTCLDNRVSISSCKPRPTIKIPDGTRDTHATRAGAGGERRVSGNLHKKNQERGVATSALKREEHIKFTGREQGRLGIN